MARTSGFSLLELMVVLIIVLTISGAVFQTINMTTQRSAAEQTKVDMFQEAREFMDQMSRDLRQAGYPSPRNYDPAVLTQNPIINDRHAAAGLVKVDAGDLWFEGGVDTVQATLTLEGSLVDPQTRKKPVTTLITTVRLNNCSQAAIGYKTSCQ